MKQIRHLLFPLALLLCTMPAWAQVSVSIGAAAAGNTAQGAPVQIGGVDSTGKARSILVDPNGFLYVAPAAPILSTYVLTSASGTATIAGYYVGSDGAQIGAYVSYSVSTATTLTTLAGGTLPTGAVGFVFSLSGAAVYVGRSGQINGTFTYAPASGPQISITTYGTLGRVSP